MPPVVAGRSTHPNRQGIYTLLDQVERRACRYFQEHADQQTGLVRDRVRLGTEGQSRVASIAATGFGLSALCIADGRRYLPADVVHERVQRTLAFLLRSAQHEHGFFYHFLDTQTGARVWGSEASSVDTAWLLCGVLHASAHFADRQIRQLCADLLGRVDWRWMLNGGTTLSHGWTPEGGFLPYRWDSYAEILAMYLLAIGSESYAIPASSWEAWKRPRRTWKGLTWIDAEAPLFAHQYSHAWFDFRGRSDLHADYFVNSQRATRAHRLMCMELSQKFPWYGSKMWGVTASSSRNGYRVWGSVARPAGLDGTLVPCAAGGSVAFLPDECGVVLETMMDRYGNAVWGKYGFVDAFQPQAGWYSPDIIGIDQGIMLLMAENLRSQSVWRAIMSTKLAERAMRAVGLELYDA